MDAFRAGAQCSIVPPYLLQRLEQHPDPRVQDCARVTLATDAALRAAGRLPAPRAHAAGAAPAAATGTPNRAIFDARNTQQLPGEQVRAEGDPATGDTAVDEAYDGLGVTWQMLFSAFGRDSLDGAGMPMHASVHYGRQYANAFWDGERMVFGDGDGEVFTGFTGAVDVIGHELAHGMTELTARLLYQGQSGALNESVSDVFGSLAKQHALGQTAESADWLIGAGLFTPAVQGEALRSMKAPGTAYDDDVLGKDPQPATMADYVETTTDYGGVHTNSGIPNHAFYLAAIAIGGHAWEAAGQVWYDVLTGGSLPSDADFVTFAEATIAAADARFGAGSTQSQAIAAAWRQVGVLAAEGEQPPPPEPTPPEQEPEPAPEPAQELVYLCRSGGFAGLVQEFTFRPVELGPPESSEWSSLLGSGVLAQLTEPAPMPDSYVYQVVVEQEQLHVTVGEHALPDDVRDLFDRTLRRA